jgi:hypothetical protein
MGLPSLDELGRKYGTDKSTLGHNYLGFYERFLAPRRDNIRSVLEIGVFKGQSVAMWADYFPNAKVVGLDINASAAQYAAGRIEIELADQSNSPDLERVASKHGPFDLIVDDGSHEWPHQIISLKTLFPHVRSDGFYILEDLVTSFGHYIPSYSGGSVLSAADYLHKLCDVMVADDVIDRAAVPDPFIRTASRDIEFITYYRYTSLIKRKA